MIHSKYCKNSLTETGHYCYKCKRFLPCCRIVRFDLPSAEGTGCDECYPEFKQGGYNERT